jgi:predicted dehydrogenase/threonine dehydrogenase-like Zn-dependent dehydrogenase
MRQVLQSLRDGITQVADVPCPTVRAGCLLIRTRTTLISAGTERMLTDFAKAGWIGKARQQPEKVRQVVDKLRTDGVAATLESVLDKLDQPLELGYCNVGTVLEVGPGVDRFEPGDRVLSNGRHAEVVCVPKNLCAKIPEGVSDESAAFGVIGAIALQGVRLAKPTLGECFLVSGLGLVGLLTVQLLRANGVRVLGADFNPARLKLAAQFGAETVLLGEEDLISRAATFSRGNGIDGVLVTAATDSSEPIRQAAEVSRQRGRIVLVGVSGLQLRRDDFYRKELSFQVSCSYGPGRYDATYEEEGRDYPLPFVRWTEQRNFQAVLDLMASGNVDPTALITHRFPLTDAAKAYAILGGKEPSLGVLLEAQPNAADDLRRQTVRFPNANGAAIDAQSGWHALSLRRAWPNENPRPPQSLRACHPEHGPPVLGVIGAGGFASKVLLPAFRAAQCRFHTVASRGGVSAVQAARKFSFAEATTDLDCVFDSPEIDTIVIATRHDSHAELTCRALAAGKHIFVEKPLALNDSQLERIVAAYDEAQRGPTRPKLMVGFNRRFAPQVLQMAKLLRGMAEPKSLVLTVNAGAIPADHWIQNPEIGGGRMIGEGCHFLDLLRFLVGHPAVEVQSTRIGGQAAIRDDKLTCTLSFADGSFGTIHYLANGHRSLAKERLEVFCGGRVLQLDNFRKLTGYGWPGFRRMNLWRQDKGHRAEVAAFCQAIQTGGPSPIPFEELVEATRLSFAAANRTELKTSMVQSRAA